MLALIAASSSSVSGTPASRAIASRWRKPLVEPPLATAPAIAFSSARRSRKLREVVPRSASATASVPARAAAASFSSTCAAGISPSPITPRPSRSTTIAIVLAVKLPAQ